MNATANYPQSPDEKPSECHLLGSFAVLVQGALGALALLSLVFKRWRERPQRPVKIWAFDASKQVFGSVLLHLANLFMSMFSAGEIQAQIARVAAQTVGAAGSEEEFHQPNPCSFYLLNLAIDTTIGIPILILILKLLSIGASLTPLANPPESIKSGNYGQPPKVTWWLKQSFIYFVGLLLMKACVFVIFQLAPWIIIVGDWALRWTEGNTALQIAFVMLIFPLIMNGMQYYIIDSFIKKQSSTDEDSDAAVEHGEPSESGGLLAGDDSQSDSIDDNEARKKDTQITASQYSKREADSYDPTEDRDVESGSGESSSRNVTNTEQDQEQHDRSSSKPRKRSVSRKRDLSSSPEGFGI